MKSTKVILDSGAFTLWTAAVKHHEENGCGKWDYYDTDKFWEYVDKYANFLKKYKIAIDLYANIDAIGNPEITYRNQKYLEDKYGLSPIPVVHYGTDLKWLKRYIKAGYPLIGLGGLVGSTMKQSCKDWISECFDMVCDAPDRLPKVKIHGFGVTSYPLLRRYPWHSVDSSTASKASGHGSILVPRAKNGRFTFSLPPRRVPISAESNSNKPFSTMSNPVKSIIKRWLDHIDIPLGSADGKKEWGVISKNKARTVANMKYFFRLVKSLPDELTLYFVGSATRDNRPEKLFEGEERIGVMLTYFDIYKNNGRPTKRIRELCGLK